MLDLDKRREIIQRGKEARDVINNPTFEHVMDRIAYDLFCKFQSTVASEEVEREKLWATSQAMSMIYDRLNALVAEGRVEEENKKLDEDRNDF